MAIFDEKIEIRERCKGVHCADLGESFPTSIYLQKSASIQPRTSPSKIGGKIQFNIQPCPYTRAESLRASDCALSQHCWLHTSCARCVGRSVKLAEVCFKFRR